MTGTGTQADPYKVSSWDELAGRSGYIEASKENDVWNLNKTNPEGVSATIGYIGKSSYFDGKGLTILNAHTPASKGSFLFLYSCTVKNVNFLNIDCRAPVCFYHGGTYNNCRFSGSLFSSKLFGGSNNYYLNRCSLNIKLNDNSNLCYGGNGEHYNFINSHLRIDSMANAATLQSELYFENSLVEGDLTHVKIKIKNYYSTKSQYSIINAKAIELNGTDDAVNNVLYNNDLIISDGTVSSALTSVTTAQLKDAAYLQSIGFPIGVD